MLERCHCMRAGATWQGSGQPGRLRKGEAATSPALNFCWGSATGPPVGTPRAAEISPAMRLRPSADLPRPKLSARGSTRSHGYRLCRPQTLELGTVVCKWGLYPDVLRQGWQRDQPWRVL